MSAPVVKEEKNEPAVPAIVVCDVSKRFRRYRAVRPRRLKEVILKPQWLGNRQQNIADQLQALEDISFVVPRGTTLGLIGHNGSGKTTLLKLISGIYRADTGSITISGRLSTLLGLGLGFHMELSGRDNVYINGLILGLSRKQIRERFDAIVDFAEIPDFIDAPVRTYSSGMFMRLAFSIAVNVDPDVLLLDEVLAVGDVEFQKKCKRRMDEFRTQGKTIVIVTHDMQTAESWCDRVLLLEHGRLKADGKPSEVVAQYLHRTAALQA
jgi:lipopolysaccharide transport system ATP-binding protein